MKGGIVKQRIEKNALRTLLILSIAIISGCAKAPIFPAKYLWEVDVKNQACGQYELIDQKALKFKHIKDWPLDKCEGVFGFSTSDIPKVLDWCADMIKLGNKRK